MGGEPAGKTRYGASLVIYRREGHGSRTRACRHLEETMVVEAWGSTN